MWPRSAGAGLAVVSTKQDRRHIAMGDVAAAPCCAAGWQQRTWCCRRALAGPCMCGATPSWRSARSCATATRACFRTLRAPSGALLCAVDMWRSTANAELLHMALRNLCVGYEYWLSSPKSKGQACPCTGCCFCFVLKAGSCLPIAQQTIEIASATACAGRSATQPPHLRLAQTACGRSKKQRSPLSRGLGRVPPPLTGRRAQQRGVPAAIPGSQMAARKPTEVLLPKSLPAARETPSMAAPPMQRTSWGPSPACRRPAWALAEAASGERCDGRPVAWVVRKALSTVWLVS